MHWAKDDGLCCSPCITCQDTELALLSDMSHLQSIKQDLASVTSNRHRLLEKSAQVVEVGRGEGRGGKGRRMRGEVPSRVLSPELVCVSTSSGPFPSPPCRA